MTSRAAIILAGGLSRRFGEDKASADLRGKPMLQHVIDRFEGLVDEFIIVKRRDQKLPSIHGPLLKIVEDRVEDAGPLAGLVAGLSEMRSAGGIATACDMPLLQPALLQLLLPLVAEHSAVVPLSQAGLPQPLCAAYAALCTAQLAGSLAAGERRLVSAIDALGPLYLPFACYQEVDPQGLSFTNMNHPSDRQLVEAVLRTEEEERVC